MSLRLCASNFCSVYVIPLDDVDHEKPSPYSMTRHPLQGSCTATHGFHIATAPNDVSSPGTGHGVMR